MFVSKFMRPHIISVGPDKTLIEIEALMEERKFRHLLVMEEEKLTGIISDRDVKKFRSLFAQTKTSSKKDEMTLEFKAHQIMSHNPIVIPPDMLVTDALKIILDSQIGCLPVVNESNVVVGIFTRTDLLKWLLRVLDFFE